MSDRVAKAFEEFLRTRRDHRDGLTARQQLWTAFEAGAQFTLDEIRERTGLTEPTPETEVVAEEGCSHCQGMGKLGTPATSCPFCGGEGVRRRDALNR